MNVPKIIERAGEHVLTTAQLAAEYETDTSRIRCGRSPSGRQSGELCWHVKFCRTYGWWEQTVQAADCPLKNPPEKPRKEAKKHES